MKTKLIAPKNLQSQISSKGKNTAGGFDFALMMLGVKFIPVNNKTLVK